MDGFYSPMPHFLRYSLLFGRGHFHHGYVYERRKWFANDWQAVSTFGISFPLASLIGDSMTTLHSEGERSHGSSHCSWLALSIRTPSGPTFRLRSSGIFIVSNPRRSFLSMHHYPRSLCLEYCPNAPAQPRPTPQRYAPLEGRPMSESLAANTVPRLQRSINVTEIINRLIDICPTSSIHVSSPWESFPGTATKSPIVSHMFPL